MSEPKPPHVVVLGGGSAGWITACLLHHRWAERGGKVTVVESSAIGIIGVGEGSTPQLKAFFDTLGIAESEWMPACDATYKLGIRFSGWSEREGFESYYHPFPGPTDLHTEPGFIENCRCARQGFDVPCHPDDWFLATELSDQGKGPQASDNFPFPPSYGYHFDAYKLGAFLREWAVARGVLHRDARIEAIDLHSDGEVAALVSEEGERIEGDVFVDCSGFRSFIAQEKLGVPFVEFSDNLFADRAIAMPSEHDGTFRPETQAVAMSSGWRWRIPLTGRVGNGYVYSSSYITDDEAETELRQALGLENADTEPRRLRMKVGRVRHSWSKNVLAAGLSQGFIEPLEATALHIVIVTALEFAQALEDGGFTTAERDRFNASIAARYDGIRDYIVAHYRLNRRTDTPFWRDNNSHDNLSDDLKALMTCWFTGGNMQVELAGLKNSSAYSLASWHCLFAGYGQFPASSRMRPFPAHGPGRRREEARAIIAACASNFAAYDPLGDQPLLESALE